MGSLRPPTGNNLFSSSGFFLLARVPEELFGCFFLLGFWRILPDEWPLILSKCFSGVNTTVIPVPPGGNAHAREQ